MAKEPTRFTINERTYIIGDWSVDKSLEIMVWVTKTFGEGFLTLFMSDDGLGSVEKLMDDTSDDVKSVEELEKEKKLIQEFASKITNHLDAKEYVKYAKLIIDGIHCGGGKINFGFHFMGKMAELHHVLFRCLRHQYGDFLGGNTEEG